MAKYRLSSEVKKVILSYPKVKNVGIKTLTDKVKQQYSWMDTWMADSDLEDKNKKLVFVLNLNNTTLKSRGQTERQKVVNLGELIFIVFESMYDEICVLVGNKSLQDEAWTHPNVEHGFACLGNLYTPLEYAVAHQDWEAATNILILFAENWNPGDCVFTVKEFARHFPDRVVKTK